MNNLTIYYELVDMILCKACPKVLTTYFSKLSLELLFRYLSNLFLNTVRCVGDSVNQNKSDSEQPVDKMPGVLGMKHSVRLDGLIFSSSDKQKQKMICRKVSAKMKSMM
jgi:hypothetical protein